MSQVLYEHTAQTAATAATDLRLRNITTAANSIMAAGSDPEPLEQPVATGDAKSHQSHSSHSTATHYVGLPYQDHNYGAPPPPTPPQSPPPPPVAPATASSAASIFTNLNGILDVEKPIAVPSFIPPAFPFPAPEPVDHKEEGETRCICNFDHDDGYMICCDRCGVWQHVECMGLERNNIPDNYFCEKCQPRPVDKIKAHQLQSKKRELIHSDSSTDSGDEDTSIAPTTATYMAISNSPTSLTLTAKHKKLKKKKKKRSKEKEHLDDKHHKRKKRRHSSRKTSSSSSSNKPEEGAGGIVQIMDEEARPPWSDESEEQHDRYEEAAFNQYSADIQHLVATHCQKQAPSINSIRQPKLRTLGQKAMMGNLGKNIMGLVANEELKKNEFIMEFKGKVMLKEQLDAKLPYFNRLNPFILLYSKFSKVNICIDATIYGNEARFVRRSCNPTAEVRHSFEDNTIHLSLYSLGNLSNGTEVTIAFDYNFKGCSFPVRCACNKKMCCVKKFRRKHHSEDGQNHETANHLITREPVEMMSKSNSNPALSSCKLKKRTVSPLRVSLSAHNEQNNAEPHPERPVNGDDLSNTTTPAPSKETDAQENQESSEHPAEETTSAQPAKKLTREERKMEAIMKAIEKMEKTEQRRQQALERIAVTKQKAQDEQPEQSDEAKPDQAKDAATAVTMADSKESQPQDSGKEQQVLEIEQVKSINVLEENSNSSLPVPPVVVPQVTAKPRPNNRRRRKGSSRRRSRVNSAASTATTSGASSMDEESNTAIQPTSIATTAPISTAPPISTDTHQLLTTVPRMSTPSTTSSASNVSSMSSASLPFQSENQSLQSIPACSKHFKFPKTKKFFMNEWLNEKALEASANKPLSIKTESLDMFSASVSSPSTPTQIFSKSSSFATTPVNKPNLDGSMGANLGGSLGSAKKRWLRQAMSDNNMKTTTTNNNGADSPVYNGTLSPRLPASPALSPNNSMNDVMMTPLKKRMLRHSIAEDRISINHQSSTPPPLVTQDKPATAPSTPTVESKLSLDETLKSSEAIKDEVEQSSASRLELCFDGITEGKKRTVPVPLPIPARKDFRKNSSLDSGLSVTTPGDFDRSPISIAGTELQTQESKDLKCDSSSVVTKVSDVEVRTSERTSSPSERHSVECKKESPSVEEPNQNSVQDRTAKELDKSQLDESSPDSTTNQQLASSSDCQTPVRKLSSIEPSASAQVRLDFSLSESQNSLSSLEQSHGSLPDLHSSCASAPELRQPPAVAEDGANNKANLSHSASSANFEWTPTKKADVCASVYSTPPRRIRDEDQSNVIEDLLNSRTRRASGPGDFRKRPLEAADPTRRRSRSGFTDDQISGNTCLYTSFASPKKKTLMMMRNSEALAAQEQQQWQTSEKMETSSDASRTFESLPDRTDLDKDSGKDHVPSLHPSEPSKHLSPPTLASSSSTVQSHVPSSLSRTSSMTSLPSAGSTPPPPPPGPSIGSPHPGLASPGRSSGDASPVLSSPVKHLTGSPAAGTTLSRLSPAGSLSPAVASPPPGMPHVKRKVSLKEYRKRKVSTAGKPSSTSNSLSTTPTSSVSAPTTPIKPPVPASPKPGLPTLPTLPIKSGLSSTRPSLPIKPGLSSLPVKAGLPSLPTLPIFDLKSKALAEQPAPGEKVRRLSLTTDAVQAITSLTSFLKEKVKPDDKLPQDDKWRSNKPAASSEDPLQKLRKELDEKNKERERRDSHNSLKRPHSPEPPPPPPSKKPSHQSPAKKHNNGLRLQIPPPPPPKIKASSESARSDLPGDANSEPTPPVKTLSRPIQHKSPGSASTPPVAVAPPAPPAPIAAPSTPPPPAAPSTPPPPARPPTAIPSTPPVRMNLAGIPGTPPVRMNPAGIPSTPPVRMNPAGIPSTPPVRMNLAGIPGTPPVRMNPAGIPSTPPVRMNLVGIPGTPPVRMNPAGIPSTPPVRMNPAGIPSTPPVRMNPAGIPSTPPFRMNPAGIPSTPPVRMNPAGIPSTPPVRMNPAGIPSTPPVIMNPAGIPSTPPVRMNPAGIPGTPPVRMNPAGFPGTPPVRMNPAGIPSTPPVIMNPAGIPSTNPVRVNHAAVPMTPPPPPLMGNLVGTPPVHARMNLAGIPGTPPVRMNPTSIPGTPLVRMNPAGVPVTAAVPMTPPPPPLMGNLVGTPPVQARMNPAGVPGTAAVPMTPPPPPLMGNLVGTPPVHARPNVMHPTYPQASAQPYNPNYNQQQQQPQPQQQPQQVHQYQPAAIVPQQQHQYPPQQQQPVQQTPVAVQHPQQVTPPAAPQPIPVVAAQQQIQVVPPPPAPGQQIPVVGNQHPQQPPPPPPQQAYNYQGYANQTQQVYPQPEKQGTAAVIEQFTKFHNQQQQQHNTNQQQYQQQQTVYNAAYQQTYHTAPGQQQQVQPQYHNPSNQTHYSAAGGGQQHKNSNSYSPRHGYYQ